MVEGEATMASGAAARVDVDFIGVGCNRAVGALAWGPCNLVAFAAHHSVAIFDPKLARVLTTLQGHKDVVNCVEWVPKHAHIKSGESSTEEKFLLSGSADGGIFCWAYLPSQNKWRVAREVTGVHEKAVTCIAGFLLSSCETLFASTSSDGTVRVSHASLPEEAGGALDITMLQSINVGTKVMVAVSLSSLPGSSTSFLMAVGGLDQQVHLYVGGLTEQFKPVCHLKGHQDWIRALDFSLPVKDESGLAVFLASSAQDRNIRMWKISAKKALENLAPTTQPSLRMYIEGPTFKADGSSWQVSLESLLVGHEDWVYSVQWQPPQSLDGDGTPSQSMRVLSASMDRTMMIWKPDPKSGIWMNIVTVGELGHTALGFYGGVWGPQGDAILAHGYSGSLHLWLEIGDDWKPQLVPSGHSAPVVDLSWGKLDRYLLSASHDQTTRLFACWERDGEEAEIRPSWHEIARPQVHGHDLNCLAVIKGPGNHRYVSGADEKVARVFEAPGAFLDSLYSFTATADADGFKREDVQIVGANMSALGLSQKPIYTQGPGAVRRDIGDAELSGDPMMEELPEARPMILTEPPLEEHLAHHTLWPEAHKLYGHGNELFAMCGDPAGRLLATACKAQTTNVAEIWLWHTNSWKVAGRLQSHSLTVTQLEFSPNSRLLLSVSRDRHFSVFHLTQPDTGEDEVQHKLLARVDAHKRIIWACSWSPCSQFFATGSRDRTVKIWEVSGSSEIRLLTTLSFKCSVTALAWAPSTSGSEELYILAIGKEDGSLELWRGNLTDGKKKLDMVFASRVDMFLCHAATIHRLCWRRVPIDEEVKNSVEVGRLQLASCGADHTVRIYNVHLS